MPSADPGTTVTTRDWRPYRRVARGCTMGIAW